MLRCVVALSSVAAACGITLRGDSLEEKPKRQEDPARAHGNRTVFIIGSSVDRYATEWFCDAEEPQGQHAKFVACSDSKRDLAVGYVFHPGVGLNGDLKPPFYNYSRYKTIFSSIVFESELHARRMVGERNPELVIVESSLWDLAVWKVMTMQDTSKERVGQWCKKDLPNLLSTIGGIFNKSRIAFRTAPTVAHSYAVPGLNNLTAYGPEGIEMLYDCVHSNTDKTGRLFGKYEVIDYHGIMEGLIKEHGGKNETLWLKDGFHPNKEPARRYFNAILESMKLPTIEKKDWGADIVPTHKANWEEEEKRKQAEAEAAAQKAQEEK